MAFFTYLLRCSDGSYYTGHTDNLDQRMAQHAIGQGSSYVATRRPAELVWSEAFPTRDEALSGELRVKGWSRAKKEALIAGDWARIQTLARNRQQ